MNFSLFVAIQALNILDIITTNKIMSSDGGELNPIVRWTMARLGRLWWTPKIAAIVLITLPMAFDFAALPWLCVILIFYIAVVSANVYQLIMIAKERG